MADRSRMMMLEALHRAAAQPLGLPLIRTKKSPGLFPANASARQAAQRCREDGYLRLVRSEPEVWAISEKGLMFLLSETSPRDVLASLLQTLNSELAETKELAACARRSQEHLEAMKTWVEKALDLVSQHERRGAPPISSDTPAPNNGPWETAVTDYLTLHHARGALEDCPLPGLYRAARSIAPDLTIGQFHDGLRRLREAGRIYLHPWTGPLYEIAEPALALLAGHEVAYYASLRS